MHKYNLVCLVAGSAVTPKMALKQKCNILSLERKLSIIAQVHQGKLQRALAELFDLSKLMLGDI